MIWDLHCYASGVPGRTPDERLDLAGSDSVTLFVERARAHEPGFMLDDAAAPLVATICRRLDGIPLAIELAAPRLKMLKPEALLARLGDRLRLLTAGSRTAVPRQQTLRAAIERSYCLLSEAEQAMLCRLGVCASSFTWRRWRQSPRAHRWMG